MSLSQSASSDKRIRVMRPAGSTLVVKWPALTSVLQSILRQLGGYQLQIDGAESMRTDVNGAIQAKISPGTGAAADPCLYNWMPTFQRNESGNDIVTLEPGSIGSVTITVAGTSILDFPRPELSIPDTADTTQIVYLKINSVTETVGDGDFVTACSIGSASIEVGTSVPSNSISTTSTLYKELFRWRNGALQSQLNRYNFALYARGPSGSATFTFLYAA